MIQQRVGCIENSVKGNLFTHGTLKSSRELVQRCPVRSRSNWDLEMIILEVFSPTPRTYVHFLLPWLWLFVLGG